MSPLEPWSALITDGNIRELYIEGIKKYGGMRSNPKEGCLEGALGAAWSAEVYNEFPEHAIAGLCFSGYLLFYLSTKHCYIDGNKRVGWISMVRVLLSLGLTVEVSEEEAKVYCLAIADGQIENGSHVVKWIAERLIRVV